MLPRLIRRSMDRRRRDAFDDDMAGVGGKQPHTTLNEEIDVAATPGRSGGGATTYSRPVRGRRMSDAKMHHVQTGGTVDSSNRCRGAVATIFLESPIVMGHLHLHTMLWQH